MSEVLRWHLPGARTMMVSSTASVTVAATSLIITIVRRRTGADWRPRPLKHLWSHWRWRLLVMRPPFPIMRRLLMVSLVSLMRSHLSVSRLFLWSHVPVWRRPHIPVSGLCFHLLLSLIFFIEISFLEMVFRKIASWERTRGAWFLLHQSYIT